AEDGIRYRNVTGVQTCALPIFEVKGASCPGEVRGGNGTGRLPNQLRSGKRVILQVFPSSRGRTWHEPLYNRFDPSRRGWLRRSKIGRASCREGGLITVVARC